MLIRDFFAPICRFYKTTWNRDFNWLFQTMSSLQWDKLLIFSLTDDFRRVSDYFNSLNVPNEIVKSRHKDNRFLNGHYVDKVDIKTFCMNNAIENGQDVLWKNLVRFSSLKKLKAALYSSHDMSSFERHLEEVEGMSSAVIGSWSSFGGQKRWIFCIESSVLNVSFVLEGRSGESGIDLRLIPLRILVTIRI